jgi:FlgD Ig-like domain
MNLVSARRSVRCQRRALFVSVAIMSVVLTFGIASAVIAAKRDNAHVIASVFLDKRTINPSSKEKATLRLMLARPAHVDIVVVDRDGFVVRHLTRRETAAEANVFVWDGIDDAGEIVPNEAYSFRVIADGDTYFPAIRESTMAVIEPLSYSRTTATLTYKLPAPCRVHVQAGAIHAVAGSKAMAGPVLKTIVDREPRGAGNVAEHWSGFDESASFYVPDLPGFAIAIAAFPLPENSVIIFGNRKRSFLDYAAHRRGQSLLPHRAHAAHHAGLDVFNDVAPRLTITPSGADYAAGEHLWMTADAALRVQLRTEGPTADAFLRQPGKIFVFVDSQLVATRKATRDTSAAFDIPLPAGRDHVIAVNWRSDYGPVAVGVIRVRRDDRRVAARGEGRQ